MNEFSCRQLEKKVRNLQSDRQDYKGWFWVPLDKSLADVEKSIREGREKDFGTK